MMRILVLVLLGACAHRQSAPPPVVDDLGPGIPDVADRCPLLLACERDAFQDSDGCPDPVLTFALGASTLDEQADRLLHDLADEIVQLGDRLVQLGVPPTILEAVGERVDRADAAGVTFDVIDCDGSRQ